jgi:putative DNA primase/helicase
MKNDQRSAQDRYRQAHAKRRSKAKAARAAKVTNAGGSALLPSPGKPMAVARIFVDECCLDDGALTLRHWRGTWWQWRRSHWSEREEDEVKALLYTFTEHAHYLNAKGEPVSWAPTTRKINDLSNALAAAVLLAPEIDQPTWLDGRESGTLVSVGNGLLNVETRELIPHSPQFFNYAAVPFDYDKNAQIPQHWYEFLHALWPDDQAAADVLGEWFGYVISLRLDLQKIFVMVGPTRGGRGVIARIETALIGKQNVCGPTLSSLKEPFGLQPMVGKSLAIISDARSGGGKDSSIVVERLLSISGEDSLDINRKNKGYWIGKLGVRVHIISNVLPRFADASSAIVGRLVVLPTKESWLGKEDLDLERKLRGELSGILNWSLDGLERLTNGNKNQFTQLKAAEEAITTMRDLASPVGAFVRDTYTLKPGSEIKVDTVYTAYGNWCTVGGYSKSDKSKFGRDLLAAFPSVQRIRPRDGDKRYYVYTGLALKTEQDEKGTPSSGPSGPSDKNATRATKSADKMGSGPSGPSGPSNSFLSRKENNLSPYSGSEDRESARTTRTTEVKARQSRTTEAPKLPLTTGRCRDLWEWSVEWIANQEALWLEVTTASLEAELRIILREEVPSDQVEAAVKQVMDLVFAS